MTTKILVADDSITIQKIINLAFSGEDIVIKCVSDGNSALERMRDFTPDIVLADIFMPGCNGYEVCAAIKEDPKLNIIPVVLLVGTFEPFDESKASRVKCDGYLTKPFNTSELINTVHTLVRDKKMSQKGDASIKFPANTIQTPSSEISILSKCNISGLRGMISPIVWESFVGKNRVLDILNSENWTTPEAVTSPKIAQVPQAPSANPAPNTGLSDDHINLIVEKVIKKMSVEVIREVAWEVVPELSESIIRNTLSENSNQ